MRPELLMPAGDIHTLYTCFRYGADAVYIGGKNFSLRAKASNFSMDEIKEAIEYAHKINKKIYITINIYMSDAEIDLLNDYLDEINKLKPDGVIISDLGVLNICRRKLQNIDIHISTQANTTNAEAALLYKSLGAKRIILSREMSVDDIKLMKDRLKNEIEIETFVHGAMCMSISGRCLLSSFMSSRSANKGACTHPCRWNYSLVESERPGEYMPIEEDDRGTYIFNSKDLCMIEYIDRLIDLNIDSFKIEGRMKTELYIASVARAYRRAIDLACTDVNKYKKEIPILLEEVKKCTYRQYTTGFFFGGADATTQVYDKNTYIKGATYFGTIDKSEGNIAYLEQKNKFNVGDILNVMKPDMNDIKAKVLEIYDVEKEEKVDSCPHSKMKLKITFDKEVEKGDVLRNIDV